MTYFGAIELSYVLGAGTLGDAQPRCKIPIEDGPAGVLAGQGLGLEKLN